MSDLVSLMAAPFIACLVLAGIHAYLGIHVLARGVIFVDLALAQIAALGAAVGVLFGVELASQASYGVAIAFACVGAGVFSLTRSRKEHVSQEAVIGIAYAVASAATVLVLDRSPHGAEQIKTLFVGSILWVTWKKVLWTAVLYAVLGVFHWVLRRRFLTVSFEPDTARAQGWHIRWWDFIFYVAFGLVVTSSVQIAGVLLVFCFLVVPAVAASLLADGLRSRMRIGWGFGAAVSAAGCVISYVGDLPTGATVVCTFAVALLLVVAARSLATASARG
jgi:zinc/manganese transport system permease protein